MLVFLLFAALCAAVAGVPIDDRLEVDDPVRVGQLAVYLIRDGAAAAPPDGDYTLLADALAAGTLVIEEVDASGSVPTLLAHNKGSAPVLAMAGEVIDGGKQDRVLTQDVLLEPSAEPQRIAVNCVERSRWSAGVDGTQFRYGGRGELGLAKTVQEDKSQASTWSKVDALNDARGKRTQTGTYMASLEDQRAADIDRGLATISGALEAARGVGVIAAFAGKLQAAEIYAYPSVFARARPGLLRAWLLDAAGQGLLAEVDKKPVIPSAAAAARFVREAQAAQEKLREAQPSADYVELEAPAATTYELRTKAGKTLKSTVYAK